MTNILLPLISFILSIISLLVDPNERDNSNPPHKRIKIILGLSMLLALICFFSIRQNIKDDKSSTQLQTSVSNLNVQNDRLESSAED